MSTDWVNAYVTGLRARTLERVVALIAWALPWVIHRSLRRGLHGVYARGAWDALPRSGVLLAANHHAWWDPYLAWLIGQRLGRPLSGLMLSETVARFPFFRAHGALATSEVREALKRLSRGELLIIFPEGGVRVAGKVAALEPGLAFLAERARVPVYPVAMRVTVRGAQHPEAFLLLGHPTAPPDVRGALNTLLAELEAEVAAADPEAPLPGFTVWSGGARSTHEKAAWLGRLLRGET
jgi:1-acyl-sn-glycerol-3-phosphate acyltransferase